MEWTHNGVEVTSHDYFDKDITGFIYRITYIDGREYIGKKLIRSIAKLKPTKEQLAIRKNFARREWKDRPFREYEGSSKNTKGLTIKSKEILELCKDKVNLNYCEVKWMMKLDVLCDEKYINDNIAGKYFRGRIVKGL